VDFHLTFAKVHFKPGSYPANGMLTFIKITSLLVILNQNHAKDTTKAIFDPIDK